MPSPHETIVSALHTQLSALPATAPRGEALPERVTATGLLILHDGEPGDPEVTLSPLRYHYQHRAEIKAIVQGADRDAAFDTLVASIGAAIHGYVPEEIMLGIMGGEAWWSVQDRAKHDSGRTRALRRELPSGPCVTQRIHARHGIRPNWKPHRQNHDCGYFDAMPTTSPNARACRTQP